jgi:tetrahydromethanopterin S-methyltransferase subunit G
MRLFSNILPYLILVSFQSGNLNDFDVTKIQTINTSPYDGVAVQLVGPGDVNSYTTNDFEAPIKLVGQLSNKHVWPWIFFNRIFGYKDEEEPRSQCGHKPCFARINAIDLYNETDSLQTFYATWRTSLQVAQGLNSPGIVVDPEAYNNYNAYRLDYVARRVQKSQAEVKRKLQEIGRTLTDISTEIYPEATIWFLFTGLSTPQLTKSLSTEKDYMTVTYIIRGMLERAKETNGNLQFVSGGEVSLGYCYESIDQLRSVIMERRDSFAYHLRYYPFLHLGGTIALWHNVDLKRGYFAQGRCKKSELAEPNQFYPYIRYLLKSYSYVWIYAAITLGYNPYDSLIAERYNPVILEAKQRRR